MRAREGDEASERARANKSERVKEGRELGGGRRGRGEGFRIYELS